MIDILLAGGGFAAWSILAAKAEGKSKGFYYAAMCGVAFCSSGLMIAVAIYTARG